MTGDLMPSNVKEEKKPKPKPSKLRLWPICFNCFDRGWVYTTDVYAWDAYEGKETCLKCLHD